MSREIKIIEAFEWLSGDIEGKIVKRLDLFFSVWKVGFLF